MTLDLLKDNVIKNMSEKKQIITMQILVVFFLVVSVVIALDPPTFIAQLMGISWGALAGAFLAPFMYGLYWKGVTRAGVWAGFISGVGITVANMFIRLYRVTDQRRGSGHGGRTCRRTGGEPHHAEAG